MSKKLAALCCIVVAFLCAASSPTFAAKNYITGACVCKKGNNVLATYSETICTRNDHDGCTAAKARCVTANLAACTELGGILTQSGKACNVGDKC